MQSIVALRSALVLALTITPTAAAVPPTPANTSRCDAIQGTIAAQVNAIVPTLQGLQLRGDGDAKGSFQGPVRVIVTRADGDLRVAATIRTGAGEIRLAGDATARRPGEDLPHEVNGALRVTGGTGPFHGAGGDLRTRGSADVGARRLTLSYTGILCSATPASEGRRS